MANIKKLVIMDDSNNELSLHINTNDEIFMEIFNTKNEELPGWICLNKQDAKMLYLELDNLIKQI